jgi:hypothetical protein
MRKNWDKIEIYLTRATSAVTKLSYEMTVDRQKTDGKMPLYFLPDL